MKVPAEMVIFKVLVFDAYVTVKFYVKAAFNLLDNTVARVDPVLFLS